MTPKELPPSPSAPIAVSGGYRTGPEQQEASLNRACFEANPTPWEQKMDHFPKYVRRQALTRILALYEIFKRVLPVKGSIVECGVNHGASLMAWAKFSAIMEPVNLTRRIYGFDSFSGFPSLAAQDKPSINADVKVGDLYANSFDELNQLVGIYDSTRFLGHVNKVKLIKGDATQTIPTFISDNKHLLISLLYLDFDLYEPTKVALEHFLPRMPKGAVIAFDELDNPLWPGETQALLDTVGAGRLRLERVEFDPYIGFAIID